MNFETGDHVIKVGKGLKTALGVCDSKDRSMFETILFLNEKMTEKCGKKGGKKSGHFLKVKRPTLLLTLYLLTH